MEENKPDPEELPVDFPDQSAPSETAPAPEPPRTFTGRPRTIEELREFCRAKEMPLEKMRFFIGENYQEPRAFGIFRSGNNFIVYKNKSDGTRAVRYQGSDEAYAVGELYDKLLDECHMRGIYPERDDRVNGTSYLSSYSGSRSQSSYSGSSEDSGGKKGCFAFLAFAGLCLFNWIIFFVRLIFHLIFWVIVRLLNPFVAIAAGGAFFLARKFFTEEKYGKKVRKAALIGIPLAVIIAGQFIRSAGNGYYEDNGLKYYKENESWFVRSGSNWIRLDSRPALSSAPQYYRNAADSPIYFGDISNSYTWGERLFGDFGFPSFPSDPGIVDDLFRDGSNSSSDWDWDSWDSSDTDWDSDW